MKHTPPVRSPYKLAEMTPDGLQAEQIAARLDATLADWAVLYGPYSRQFVAFPTAALSVPAEYAGLIIENDIRALERAMALVHGAANRAESLSPAHDVHQRSNIRSGGAAPLT